MSSDPAGVLSLRSPWADTHPGRRGHTLDPAGLTVTLLEPTIRLGLEPWPAEQTSLEHALGQLTGCRLPPAGRSSMSDGVTVLSTAPGRWQVLLEGPKAAERHPLLLAALRGQAAVIDLTHGFALLGLAGPAAVTTLNQLVRIDLHMEVFPPGAVSATELHGMAVQLRRLTVDCFQLAVATSFAHSLLHAIVTAGAAKGVTIER